MLLTLKYILAGILVFTLLAGFVYGAWTLERKFHYKYSYQTMVQQEIDNRIKPLSERVQKLEAEIEVLKKK